ncbi:MAG TPA: hypothetical protein PKK41_05895 [Methanoculleus sp.]|jgi:hypothetical protein|nr:hypothetical protein [Methanoculleus sp.]
MTRGIAPRPESIPVPNANPVYSSVADLMTMGEAVCRITNSTNKVVTILLQTALGDDPTFAKPNESGDGFVGATDVGGISVTGFVSPATSSVALAAGATTYARVSGAWSYARVKATPAEAPAEGGTIGVSWGYKHRGD